MTETADNNIPDTDEEQEEVEEKQQEFHRDEERRREGRRKFACGYTGSDRRKGRDRRKENRGDPDEQ